MNKEKVFLFVDFQERLMPVMDNVETLEDKVIRLAKGAVALDMPILVTEQYTKGLGFTVDPLKEVFEDKALYFEKTSFSAVGEEGFMEFFEKNAKGYKEIIICGIEAHICVLQTALDFMEKGYKVRVVEDCVRSRSNNDKKMAVRRMRSEGMDITTCETILFEILGGAKVEGFKEISKIIK